MNYHWLIPLLAALASLALAVLVFRARPLTAASRMFALLASALVLWNLNFFVLYGAFDRDLTVGLTRLLRVGALFLPATLIHLVFVLRNRKWRGWRCIIAINYTVASALTIANILDMFVRELRPFAWGYYSVGTSLYDVFSAIVVANCCVAIVVLVHDYQSSTEPRERVQLKFWLVGAVVAIPLACTNLLPAYGVPLYPLGNLGTVAWAAIVAYAIVRHRLMDVDIVITKGVAYAAVSLGLIAPAFALILWLQRSSFGQIHVDFSFAVLLMLVVVGALFPALRLRAESRIERSLFREKHEYRSALAAFAHSIVRILDRPKLLRELGTTLSETLQLDRLAICLLDENERVYSVRYATGVVTSSEGFGEEHPFVQTLRRRDEVVLRDEIEASADATDRAAVTDVCRRNGWEVCIPLTVSGRSIGFISLGRKRNLEAFYAEDLHLLGTLGAEAAIALENARLYEELKKSRDIIHRTGRLSALGTLAAGIAHEVRNPLVSIQTFFQLAPQRLNDKEFFTSFLSLTAGEVQRISDLISELLTFARSPTHRLYEVDVNDLIERATLLLEPEARKCRVKLSRSLETNLPFVRADGDQIKQVVINLVLNAIQATEPGGAVVVATRRLVGADGDSCQIEVRDTGIGICQGMLDDIFNPFFTTKDKGTGLGLSIAHQIVTEHGGGIAVSSEEGRGSVFCVTLPVSTREEASTDAEDETRMPVRYGRMAKL
jgi:two-component system NtrC family sensor kinase